jgi:uncharacterized protein (TIGR03437 family)
VRLHRLFSIPARSFRRAAGIAFLLLLLCLVPARAAITSIVVSPTSVSLIHGQTQQFVAVMTGDAADVAQGATWSINSVGSIDPVSGLYSAPASVFQVMTVVVTARANADNTRTATATVTLRPTVTLTISPASATVAAGGTQQFTATVSGTTNTAVTWSISPRVGSIASDGTYSAPATVTQPQNITVTAVSVADPTQSQTAVITLQPAVSISVAINPTSVMLSGGQQQQFTATVTGTTNTTVSWSFSPSNLGTLDQTGLYTAPSAVSSTTSKVTVTATSAADQTKSASATITFGVFTDIGSGAPNQAITTLFLAAFYRGFQLVASTTPKGPVKRLGTTGLVQEFPDINKTAGVTLALVMPNQNITSTSDPSQSLVFQMLGDLYTYYTSVGVSTAGYPTMDTQKCPPFDPANSCTWSLFSNNYALFAYQNPIFTGQNFSISGNFYTEWIKLNGISGPGRPTDGQVSTTASTGSAATAQTFARGAIYQYSSGPNNGKYFGVVDPIYSIYSVNNGGPSGILGFPIADEIVLSSGVHHQSFEGGALEYTPGSDPTLRLPVASIGITGVNLSAPNVPMKLGDTLTVTARPATANGVDLTGTGRIISWSTSNSRVITIQATNETAVLKAVGGGTASVAASSEGVVSQRINILVTAPCCQIGDGAPATVQQSFQDTLTRNRLSVIVPAAAPASRVGNGYVQLLQSSDPANPAIYMLAKTDRLGTTFVVTGDILKRYQSLGGPGGTLGYPTTDATSGGRQLFENSAALAGNPVRLVGGAILSKWALLSYETGVAGSPTAEAGTFSTFGANSGGAQQFANGTIYAATAGPRSGQSYFVGGLILARYTDLGGAGGDFGMPVSDEIVSGNLHQQNFEGGTITYATGDAVAVEQAAPKTPGIVASPASAIAGSRVHLAVVGFPSQSTLRVSVSGQPDFLVTTPNGAYAWDIFVPLSATTGLIAIHAADTQGPSSADGAVTIKGLADNRVQLSKVQGDNQTGVPGGLLPRSLRIALRDSSGGAVAGATVTFQGSPGAQVMAASAVTDANGQAETWVRLPAQESIVLINADSPGIAQTSVTFSVRSAASSLSNYPKLLASGDTPVGNGQGTLTKKGALLAAIASMLRYHQNNGDLPAPNGLADQGTLNQFLKNYCNLSAAGKQVCDGFLSNPDGGDQVVNPWRVGEFVGGGVDPVVSGADTATAVDWIGQGWPVLLSLAMTLNGAPAGGHYVVAIGVGSDGGILIADPSPTTARTNLADYLNGFSAGGAQWKGQLRGVLRFALRTPAPGRFLVAALSQSQDTINSLALSLVSQAGDCGKPLDLIDAANLSSAGAIPALVSRLTGCDGSQPAYQLSEGASQPFRTILLDLGGSGGLMDLSGNAPNAWQVARVNGALAASPLQVSFTADSVYNAASLTPGLAPGSLMAIMGTGLTGAKGNATVELDGTALSLGLTSPFQINALVPIDVDPGMHILKVRSDYGELGQQVPINSVAPAIFLSSNPARGAVMNNQNGTANSSTNPNPRGQALLVYATGLGAVTSNGDNTTVSTTVTVVLSGQELPVSFAGLAPDMLGVYQVIVPIPTAIPPGLDLPFALKQGGVISNIVPVSIQ